MKTMNEIQALTRSISFRTTLHYSSLIFVYLYSFSLHYSSIFLCHFLTHHIPLFLLLFTSLSISTHLSSSLHISSLISLLISSHLFSHPSSHLLSSHFSSHLRLYGDHATEILDLLRKNPAGTIPVVLKRLKQKDAEWRRARLDLQKLVRTCSPDCTVVLCIVERTRTLIYLFHTIFPIEYLLPQLNIKVAHQLTSH